MSFESIPLQQGLRQLLLIFRYQSLYDFRKYSITTRIKMKAYSQPLPRGRGVQNGVMSERRFNLVQSSCTIRTTALYHSYMAVIRNETIIFTESNNYFVKIL